MSISESFMPARSRLVLSIAFTGSFLFVGFPYWQIPYAQLSLPNAIWGLSLIGVAGLAALTRVISVVRYLWPFEIILAAGPGLLAAGLGALAGGLLADRGGV